MLKSRWLTVASCLHIGAEECREDLIAKWLEAGAKVGASIALIGDLLDMGMFVGTAHSGSVWENTLTPEEQIERAVKLLKPHRRRIAAIMTGNHEDRLRKATSIRPNRRIAAELGILNRFADITKVLRVRGRNVFLSHGASRGDFVNTLKGWEGVDVFALGHTHTLSKEVVRRRSRSGTRDVNLVRCGTFLQEPRYGRVALYPPNPIGAAWIRFGSAGSVRVDLGVVPE